MYPQQQTSNKIDLYYEHYHLFCNNINPSFRKELGIEINDNHDHNLQTDWKPPSNYGLSNSERIIPQHYFERNQKSMDIDMFYELTKDIRNLKPLNHVQLNFIKTLPKEKVMEIIELYNLCLQNMEEFLNRL